MDIIGLDVYDTEWAHYPGHVAEWSHMLNQAYGLNWLASFAAKNHKPISFPEWGLGWSTGGMAGGGDNAYFVEHVSISLFLISILTFFLLLDGTIH